MSFRKHQERISKQFTLNEAQTRAFMIITDHINGDNHLKKDNKQDQLCVHELRKLAPKSNAAAQIDGLTIHSFTSYRNLKTISAAQRTTIEKARRHVRYIIIDEMSMVDVYLLGQLDGLLTVAKHCSPSILFGDINVIFFGDFIQYDPVGDQSLYSDIISDKTQKKKNIRETRVATCASGRALWEQINTVVKLEKQMRTIDDHELLTTRVIDPNHEVKSLDTDEWKKAPILVFRNELRTELSILATASEAFEKDVKPLVCIAQDEFKININNPDFHKYLLESLDNKTKWLPGYLPLVPGLHVLWTENIATELKLCNGTTAVFRESVYEQAHNNLSNLDTTKFPIQSIYIPKPLYALVEIENSRTDKLFDTLPPKLIPIPPVTQKFMLNIKGFLEKHKHELKQGGRKLKSHNLTIKRTQLPLAPTYAMTTHKSQGQTMPKIVIDLVFPPRPSKPSVAQAYVPLSRVKELKHLVILRKFHIKNIQIQPNEEQLRELNRLDALEKEAKRGYELKSSIF
ncbi:unnamed protein product [Didymodactylos carnosus]|uniref:ATP-dependent DNA helicase n=1 Tax=Didymodactylos carnosus TaxID=1234261 RepID=A0A815DEG4_9BILA|nr:unnamed protein product [Didymodactylos carnosus]CAF4110395.1 unnamed protein product [Didymodactylos carnosus]